MAQLAHSRLLVPAQVAGKPHNQRLLSLERGPREVV